MEGCVYRKAQRKRWLPLLSLCGSGSQTRPASLALRAGAGSGRGVRPATQPERALGGPEPAGVTGECLRARSQWGWLLPAHPCSSRRLSASDREPLICSVSERDLGAAASGEGKEGRPRTPATRSPHCSRLPPRIPTRIPTALLGSRLCSGPSHLPQP